MRKLKNLRKKSLDELLETMPTISELQLGKFVGGGGQDSCYYCVPNNAHGYYFDPGGYYSGSYFNGSGCCHYSDSSYYSPYSFGGSYSDSSAYWLRTSQYSAYEANSQTLNYSVAGYMVWEGVKYVGMTALGQVVLFAGGVAILFQGDSSPARPTNDKPQGNYGDYNNWGYTIPQPSYPVQPGGGPNMPGGGMNWKWQIIPWSAVLLKQCSDNTKVPYRNTTE